MTETTLDDGDFSVAVSNYTPDGNPFGHGAFLDENPGAAYHFEDAIDFFDATPEADFLSNFYPSPFTVPVGVIEALLSPMALSEAAPDGVERLAAHTWPTGEHFFQALKADHFNEVWNTAWTGGPGAAKSRGRQCKMRADWPEARVEVMRVVLAYKFAPDTELAARLLATETKVLIEGTMWGDRIWGVYRGSGLNLLGVLLMEQRGYLKAVRDGR